MEEIPEFQTATEVFSMGSLALTLGGHQPIKENRFDVIKFEDWCKKNSLLFYLDKKDQIFNLKCN